MNFKIMFSAGLMALAAGSVFAQNKSNGPITTTSPISPALLPPGNTEAFRFSPGLITQLDAGTAFDFTAASQWISFGRLSTTGQTLYGFRAQRAGRGLIFGYSGAPQATTPNSPPTLGTPVIEWVGEGAVSQGDLLFRTSASSTSATSTEVLKLRSDATALFSGGFSVYDNAYVNDNYPGVFNEDIYGFYPKVEANDFAGRLSISGISQGTAGDVRSAVFISKNTGISGSSYGSGNYAFAANNGYSYGTFTKGENSNGTGSTYGVYSLAKNGNNNKGVYASVTAPGSLSFNYGSYSVVNGSNTTNSINYGVYASATGYNAFAGYFAGKIFSTTNLVVSDKSLKTEVKKEEKVLEKISSLNPVNYSFIQGGKEMNLTLPDNLQHGFIAQELEEIFPELVEEVLHPINNEKGEQIGTRTLKSVNYIGLISLLTQSVIELNEEVESLKGQLANNSKTYVVTNNNTLSPEQVKDIVANGYYLGQNTPNPFSEVTVIEYSLPEGESDASVWIMNLNGQMIKEYKLTDKKGSITVTAGALEKGVYLYSLIGSGQEIISKKMVIK